MSGRSQNPLKRIIGEIHRRSLWQVLAIYGVASWVAFEVVQTLTEGLGLPGWLPGFAFVLLVIGLPIVLATAFVQEGVPRAPTSDASLIDAAGREIGHQEAAPDSLSTARRVFTWRNAITGGVLAFALWGVLTAGWLILGPGTRAVDSGESVANEDRPSIAALPFENRSAAEQDAYFADGIHDEILTQLSKIEDLSVRGRTSVMQYRDSPKNLRQIGQELRARYLLEGGVLRAGNEVRINVQLIDAERDEHVWAETYDRPLSVDNLLHVQSDVAARVARALRSELTPEERDRVQATLTDNLDAYDAYLRGTVHFSRQLNDEDVYAAVENFERAVELDPEFAAAWARLANARVWLSWNVCFCPEQLLQAADDLVRAERLQPDLDEVRIARGWYLYYGPQDFERALSLFSTAVRDRPNDARLLGAVGALQRRLGQWEKAASTWEEVLGLEPNNYLIAYSLGQIHQWTRRYDQAERFYRLANSIEPGARAALSRLAGLQIQWRGDTVAAREALDEIDPALRPSRNTRVRLHLYRGDLEGALDALLAGRANSPEHGDLHWLPWLYGRLGNRRLQRVYVDSLRLAEEAMIALVDSGLPEARLAGSYVHRGLALARLGRPEAGVENGRRGMELRGPSVDAHSGPFYLELFAWLLTEAGHHDEAVEHLAQLLSIPAPFSVHNLRLDPLWDPLRDHPRFQALLEEYDEG